MIRRTVLIAALLLGFMVPSYLSASPASAQDAGCVLDPITLQCTVRAPIEQPSRPGTSTPSPGTGNSGGGNRPAEPPSPDPGSGDVNAECTQWQVETGPEAEAYLARINAPEGYVSHICVAGQSTGRRAAFAPGQQAAPRSAEQIAGDLWAEVKTQMTAPVVASDPPVDTPSLVTLPVFVEVTNWQGARTETACEGPVCVSITATPTLLLYSGEPEAEPVVCDPPGTRFDPNGADPEVQAAAPGACAYVYTLRSGVEGRPEAWPAEVRVTWDVAWQGGGDSGEFDPMTLATAIPRQVSEVQTVVVDGSTE